MRVTAVRPYGDGIRERVFEAVAAAGLELRAEDVVPPGTADEVVLAFLRARPGHVLLVPFHAQRDSAGNRTNGLQLLRRLEEQSAEFAWAVLMPVSRYGIAAAQLMLRESGPAAVSARVRERVLLIEESALDGGQLPGRIREHVRRWTAAAA